MGTAEMTELDVRDEMVESEDEEEMRTEEGLTAKREKESLGAGAEFCESEARAVEESEGEVGDAGAEGEGDTCTEVDTGVEGSAKEGRGTVVSELNKQEGWPRWLQEAVDMLHRGGARSRVGNDLDQVGQDREGPWIQGRENSKW